MGPEPHFDFATMASAPQNAPISDKRFELGVQTANLTGPCYLLKTNGYIEELNQSLHTLKLCVINAVLENENVVDTTQQHSKSYLKL